MVQVSKYFFRATVYAERSTLTYLPSSINTHASSQLLEYRRHTVHIQISEHNKYTTCRRHSQFVFTIRSSIHAIILISFRVSWKAVAFSGAFNVPNNKHLKMTGTNVN